LLIVEDFEPVSVFMFNILFRNLQVEVLENLEKVLRRGQLRVWERGESHATALQNRKAVAVVL